MCDHVDVNGVGKSFGRDGKYFGIFFIMLEFLDFGWFASKK